MLFFSYPCLFLSILGFLIYIYLPQHRRLVFLFGLSLVFYSYTGWKSTALLYLLISINYAGAFFLTGPYARPVFYALISLNLLNLAFFKYTLFLLDLGAKVLGLTLPPGPWQHILLPIGISFYTFELISYIADVYQGRLAVCRSFLTVATFTTFFPHLIAGPIMRGHELFPQLENLPLPTPAEVHQGVLRFLLGLFKKLVFVDACLAPRADALFQAPLGTLNPGECLFAVLFFGFQIYLDFSAYCDMALGLARCFSINLTENFRTPYWSLSPMEFWQRWNITLSRWIRDYLYIPLGGSRVSRPHAALNLVITMFLAGLWHGASLSFAAWGLYHGVLLVIYHYLEPFFPWLRPGQPRIWRRLPSLFLAWLLFFLVVQLGWIFFRAPHWEAALYFWSQIFSPVAWAAMASKPQGFNLLTACLVFHGLEAVWQSNRWPWGEYWLRVPALLRGLAYAGVLLFIWVKSTGEPRSFIYFQF
jgi:alginate O-acetyltransferase complex protein AlgI